MRTLNFTVRIEDNDIIEHNLRKHLHGLLGDKLIDIKTLPKVNHLKENENYKKLSKAKRDAQLQLDRYVNNNRKPKININDVTDLEVADVDTKDYPDFSDAFFSSGTYNGRDLTDDELEQLAEDYAERLNEMAYEYYI